MRAVSIQIARALVLAGLAASSSASLISIEEATLFVNHDDLAVPLEDSHFYSPYSNFVYAGFSVSVDNQFSADNLGQFEWSVTNNSGQSLDGLTATVFFDASIQDWGNYHYNESAQFVGNTSASTWEADEPGFLFGDIYDNARQGTMDNTNTVAPGWEDDPALALGFYIPEFNLGDTFQLTLQTSLDNIGGFYQYDPDLDFGFYMNASVSLIPGAVPVTESGTWVLLGVGVLGLAGARRRRLRLR